ncbi:PHP domain-containing protein [Haloarcula hispanica]|jgi:predicted metal-dependent phosphoesterase TrpH/energy-coupling factor transporter ATP-binding protein EcfA2|uniref:PHP domain-containing protein n=1 Tax=Haloarcula hispanica TaxID=51589 RepID=A0A5J5LC72_HALHI|nr:PHP domain-containing protein [Haloarcula hispanica]KAA9404621.1 PHP domain-containing protein [Haloarcula hispanica]
MVTYDTAGGADFYKADLHVHTPGSYDYDDSDAEPEDLIERFEEEGIELVAVTDHNTVEYYEPLREAAEDSNVTVLPGVEITTGQSGEHQIHMTAIFPPEEADSLVPFLHEIGITEEPEHAIADVTIPNICEKTKEYGGLPILAHIDAHAGADYELEDRNNPTRQNVFDKEKVAALEVVVEDTAEDFEDFAHIRSSDSHSLADIGERYTFVKMDSPSFEGLRTAFADPTSRLSLTEEPTTHPSVDGLLAHNGFLQERNLQFNKNLNCLIGGKGTGKSTVIEHIRYALDIEPRSDGIKEDYNALIENTLRPDGSVELIVTASNGDQYRITRDYDERPEIERLSADSSGSPQEVDIPIEQFKAEFFDVEIHSQRELIELARDQIDQLDLLDSYFDITDELETRKDIKQNIRAKNREMADLREEVSSLKAEEERFEALQQQVEVMEQKGVGEYVEGQEEWEQERAAISNLIEDVETVEQAASSLSLADQISTTDIDDGPNADLLDEADETISELKSELAELEEELEDTVDEGRREIEDIRQRWNEENEQREDEHEALADEIEEEIGVDIEEFFDKKAALEDLRGVSEELEAKKEELATAKEEKTDLLENLQAARQNLSDARNEGIEALNTHLGNVRVALHSQSNRREYTDWINHVLEGSGVWTEHKEQITEAIDPPKLADIVRNNDTEALTEIADVTPTTAENFVTHDDLNEQLTKLELFEIHDRPVIELNDGGWKDLSEMSDGQQCTALLSIAMIERDVPLIIDQPEDMLDNKFIFTDVVDIIRSIKQDRQVVAATHNANIPILGDAEQIVVMRSNGRAGFYRDCGSIDDEAIKSLAQEILEGGELAFQRRREMYRLAI